MACDASGLAARCRAVRAGTSRLRELPAPSEHANHCGQPGERTEAGGCARQQLLGLAGLAWERRPHCPPSRHSSMRLSHRGAELASAQLPNQAEVAQKTYGSFRLRCGGFFAPILTHRATPELLLDSKNSIRALHQHQQSGLVVG